MGRCSLGSSWIGPCSRQCLRSALSGVIPNWVRNPFTTRKKGTCVKYPLSTSFRKRSAPKGAQSGLTSTRNGAPFAAVVWHLTSGLLCVGEWCVVCCVGGGDGQGFDFVLLRLLCHGWV